MASNQTPMTMTLELPHLHPAQREVWDDPARFHVLATGRRWGKSRLGALLCLAIAARGGRAWWVGPSYPVASIGWRMLRRLVAQIPGAVSREGERMITLPNGGTIQVKSADNPDSLRGEGLDFVVIDECAFVREEAWTEALRPALADRKGGALFCSTPKGRNWFWRLWHNADGETWRAWRFSSYANPFIDPKEIDAAKAQLPERIFQQEFMAEFILDSDGVFRHVLAAATATPLDKPRPGSTYVAGLDWALSVDFTVLTILDATTRRMVYLDRFNGVDYSLQRQRIAATCRRFGVVVVMAEENAMGKPNNDELRKMGLPVRDFTTTNASKAEIVEGLASAFEQSQVAILNEPYLLAELQAYGAERMASGQTRYSAPVGMHDDCVMSLALAWHGALRGMPRAADSWRR